MDINSKYKVLRNELNLLGYQQKLVPECIPLVEKLILDLNQTTNSLQKYMKISQHAIEERDSLKLGAEPYKCDNAKLIRECNDLHQAFIHFKEQHEKIQRDLRLQVSNLHTELENCNMEKNKLINDIQNYEKNKFQRGANNKNKPSSTNNNLEEKKMMLCKCKSLGAKSAKLISDNQSLQEQVKTRDIEITRLQAQLEGGKSHESLNKECCCYKNIDKQIATLQQEIIRLKQENVELQIQIKDAISKQHEAMRRALHLAERNKELEKELKDVDEIALAVESQCNNTVKDHSEKLSRLQARINDSLGIIQELERENAKLKQTKLELSADLETVKLEKCLLKKQFENEQQDRKNLADRINNYTIIENDLNLEIDRLTKINVEQKRRIIELESGGSGDHQNKILRDSFNYNTKVIKDADENMSSQKQASQKAKSLPSGLNVKSKKSCKKHPQGKNSSSKKTNSSSIIETQQEFNQQRCCCESGNCIKNLKDLLDKEVEYRQVNAKQSLEDLRQEKEYYMKEYHKALEQIRNIPNYEISENGVAQIKQQLKDKENQIQLLQEDIQRLRNGNISGNNMDSMRNCCSNIQCRGRERELDVKSKELNRLEIENNNVRTKLQSISETSIFNEERMKKAFKDMEEHIRKLEDERRNLVTSEGTYRSNISHLETDYRNVKDQLKKTENDLNNQRTNYNQLKLLNEQTDRALAEAQTQVIQLENELGNTKSRIKDSSRDNIVQDKEINKLSSDLQVMKNQLSRLDNEKDDLLNKLDEKTERIAELEDDLSAKNKLINKLENDLKELSRKLGKHVIESSSQEQLVRTKQQELNALEQEYEKERKLKEAATTENKRLQNDLSCTAYDCREARKELEIFKRQVEDLKRQLQHYVAEVKRTEDLISQKELERSELLDQFKSLSQEANILENNNHTLETVATQSKIQLSVALDHTSDLETRLQHHENVVKNYEKQISELSAHVAKLEVQLNHNLQEQEQCKIELKQTRDLCIKLDKEKDLLRSELTNYENRRSQVQKLSENLYSEKENLQKALERERNSLESVEKLLNDARHDLTQQRLMNQDLHLEVNRIKQKANEFEEKLRITTEKLDIFQGKALEYSQQNKQLRREIANERFSSKTKLDDKGYYPSL